MSLDESLRDASELKSRSSTSTEGVTSPISRFDIGATPTESSSERHDELSWRWRWAELGLSPEEGERGNEHPTREKRFVARASCHRVEGVGPSANHDWSWEERRLGELDGESDEVHRQIDISNHQSSWAEFTNSEETEERKDVHAPIASTGESIRVVVTISPEESEISESESPLSIRSRGVTVVVVQSTDHCLV
jgi:hypothetical protein